MYFSMFNGFFEFSQSTKRFSNHSIGFSKVHLVIELFRSFFSFLKVESVRKSRRKFSELFLRNSLCILPKLVRSFLRSDVHQLALYNSGIFVHNFSPVLLSPFFLRVLKWVDTWNEEENYLRNKIKWILTSFVHCKSSESENGNSIGKWYFTPDFY